MDSFSSALFFFGKTQVRLPSSASAFQVKRKCVSGKTQVRFDSNASAFFLPSPKTWKMAF